MNEPVISKESFSKNTEDLIINIFGSLIALTLIALTLIACIVLASVSIIVIAQKPKHCEFLQHREFIEGVLVEAKHQDGDDVLVFEQEKITVYLGDHKIYPGEWNCIRVNSQGYVQEVFLGEDWRERYRERY
jgi:hypothetical protein